MTEARPDIAGLVAELRATADGYNSEQWRRVDGWHELGLAASLLNKAADALEALTSRSMEAGEDGITKSQQAYQVIGYLDEVLAGGLGKPSSEEMIRAMDYFCGDTVDEEFLPWPRSAALSPVPGEGVTDQCQHRARTHLTGAYGWDCAECGMKYRSPGPFQTFNAPEDSAANLPHKGDEWRDAVIEEIAVMAENEMSPGEPIWNELAQVMAEKIRALKSPAPPPPSSSRGGETAPGVSVSSDADYTAADKLRECNANHALRGTK